MKRLGELLLELGWITNQDLARALEVQREQGGRLGTNLLEVDALTEKRLLQALAQQMGVEPVKPIDLQNVPEGISGLVAPRLACRLMAVPYRLLGSDLWVALLDAGNLTALDELAFATGKKLRPHVASEVRLELALERYYSRPASSRSHALWQRISEELAAGKLSPEAAEEVTTRLAPGSETAAGRRELLTSIEQALASGESTTQPIPTAEVVQMVGRHVEPSGPGLWLPPNVRTKKRAHGLEQLIGALSEARTRDEVGNVVIEHLGQRFARVGLFSLRRDHASGWLGCGAGYDEKRMAGFTTAFDEPSLFLNLSRGGMLWAGALPEMPAHERLLGIWGVQLPRECLVYPVDIAGRRAAVIFCDAGERQLASDEFEEIAQVAEYMAKALTRVIVDGKRHVS